MQTNKEKANLYVQSQKTKAKHFKDATEVVRIGVAETVIELVSIPNWYYPSKNEFPKQWSDNFDISVNILFVCKGKRVSMEGYRNIKTKLWKCFQASDITFTDEEIEAWMYLPEFKKQLKL